MKVGGAASPGDSPRPHPSTAHFCPARPHFAQGKGRKTETPPSPLPRPAPTWRCSRRRSVGGRWSLSQKVRWPARHPPPLSLHRQSPSYPRFPRAGDGSVYVVLDLQDVDALPPPGATLKLKARGGGCPLRGRPRPAPQRARRRGGQRRALRCCARVPAALPVTPRCPPLQGMAGGAPELQLPDGTTLAGRFEETVGTEMIFSGGEGRGGEGGAPLRGEEREGRRCPRRGAAASPAAPSLGWPPASEGPRPGRPEHANPALLLLPLLPLRLLQTRSPPAARTACSSCTWLKRRSTSGEVSLRPARGDPAAAARRRGAGPAAGPAEEPLPGRWTPSPLLSSRRHLSEQVLERVKWQGRRRGAGSGGPRRWGRGN